MAVSAVARAEPALINGKWYQAATYDQSGYGNILPATSDFNHLKEVENVARSGGHFVFVGQFLVNDARQQVIDFKNTTIIAHYVHYIYDVNNHLVKTLEGGIQSDQPNPFFLRHGRELDLSPGEYHIVTQVISPFFLGALQLYSNDVNHYRESIKYGNALALMSLGIYIGLGIYYFALAGIRLRLAEAMYALFILGNLLFGATALLVLSDVLHVHSIYPIGFSILFSNIAYIVFVITLLGIRGNPKLFLLGKAAIGLLLLFVLIALIKPNWSLELSRYGVAVFLCYGLLSAVVKVMRGNLTAKRYLVAIGIFFITGWLTISRNSVDASYTVYIEHFGAISTAVEIVCLSLVLSFQFSELQREKDSVLQELKHTAKAAFSDALTGLPNRHALMRDLLELSENASLTFIDLDGLKHYNDSLGHDKGDELLQEFGKSVIKQLAGRQTLYRLGGDEFAIICQDGNVSEVLYKLEQAIVELHSSGYQFAGASAGSAFIHEESSISNLMSLADGRMYRNKKDRKQLSEKA